MFFASIVPRWTLRAAAALAVLIAADAHAQSEVLPTGFALEPVITDVFEPGRPVGFAQLPDGRFLILERNTAQVRLYAGGASAPVIHTVPGVSTEAERGLLGVAVDPGWPARPYVYLYYTHGSGFAHLVLLTATGDLSDPASVSLQLTAPYLLLDDIPDVLEIHNGGTLRFGPDGMLYLSLGDDGNACNAQDLTVLSGGILRLDVSAMPGGGSGPPPKAAITPSDNPFPGPDENERLMVAWGLRNPFRFTIDPLTGDLFIGDVGLVSFEEVNRVPAASGGGENFGWPHREGLIDPGVGLTCGEDNTFTDPIYVYPHGALSAVIGGPAWRSLPGRASIFPPEYDGSVFLMGFYGGFVRRLVEDGGVWTLADPVPGQPDPDDWGTSFLYYADFQLAADGEVYVLRLIPSASRPSGLYRVAAVDITAVPEEEPAGASALAFASPNPARGSRGTEIRWTASRPGRHGIRILDAAGRLVRALTADVSSSAGVAVALWDGRTDSGRSAPAGVYFYSVEGPGGERLSGRLVLLR